MLKTIRYGIIGCGMMGREHIKNIALLESAEVGAICEPDAEMRARAARLAPEAEISGDLDAVAARDDVDCWLIASPNHVHVEQLARLSAQRPRPILVEKPLYTDPAQWADLDALRRAYPAPIWVAMEYRYMPPIAKFLEELEAATGGVRMLTIREHRFPFLEKVGDWNRFNRNTGGTFVEKCCHFFDLMRLALRSEPVRVMASAGQAVNHLDERYGGEIPDIWDHGYVIVDFESGARAMLELSMFAEGSRFQEELSAVGGTGKIEARVPGPTRFWPAHLGAPPVPEVEISPRDPQGPYKIPAPVDPELLSAGDHNGATYYQHRKFLEVVRGEGGVEVTLEDGAWAVAMGLAAQKSALSGAPVRIEKDLSLN